MLLPCPPHEPPTKLVLWRPGLIRGDFGECLWDREAAQAVMREYEARGNPIPIDVEHNSNPEVNPTPDPAKPAVGGGYCCLTLDAEGCLVLDPIQWSAWAAAEIRSGSRRAVSPDWDFDPRTKRPLRLKKVSLVQNPGTYGIGLIASAATTPPTRRTARGSEMNQKDLQAVIAGLLALSAAAADEEIKAQAAELAASLKRLADAVGINLEDDETEIEGPPVDPMAPDLGMGMPPAPAQGASEEEDPTALIASARLLQGALAKQARARSSKPADTRQAPRRAARIEEPIEHIVDRKLAEHTEKQNLIASARHRPGMTPQLAAFLITEPLVKVRDIVRRLPPAPPPEGAATAGAAGAVRVGPLGTTAGRALSSAEQTRIDKINRAGATRAEIVENATAAARATEEPGTRSFSAFSQMKKG